MTKRMVIPEADPALARRLAGPALELAEWYRHNARPLPWREDPTPYRVWVSEVMLQQTRIETVIPYYERFMKTLPDIRDLAAAETDLLLKLWEGLGYYSRIRNMHKAAAELVAHYGGRLPAAYPLLLKLPGFGEYIAGAVGSIAFRLQVPAVDGNVLRVLARLTASGEDITRPDVRRSFRMLVQEILPEGRAGDFNQGIMELGETVCLPNTAPRCDACPLSAFCEGHRGGAPERLPVRSPRRARAIEKRTVLVAVSGGKVLLRRRPENGLLGGMWELPNLEGWLEEPETERHVRDWGAGEVHVTRLEDARHVFSHLEWHMRGYRAETSGFPPPDGCIWADAQALQTHALPSAFRRYSRRLAEWLK